MASEAERLTVVLTLEQAEALIDAATCLAVAADNDIADLINVYTPQRGAETTEADRYKTDQANIALSAAQLLRKLVDDVYKRDPAHQDFLHRLKINRRRGRL